MVTKCREEKRWKGVSREGQMSGDCLHPWQHAPPVSRLTHALTTGRCHHGNVEYSKQWNQTTA